MTTFQLDPSIAVWIVLPIFAITTLVTLLRQGFADLNQKRSAAAGEDGGAGGILPGAKQTLTDVHVKNVASMSRLLRLAAGVIPASRMKPRKAYFAENKLTQPPQAGPNPFQAMMSQDPSKMAGAMKYNMVFLVLNAGAAYLISYLFSECVVARMPFDLSRSFKPVLQRGIDVDALDPSFVSALSWYFLVLFCSSSFLYIVNLIFQLSMTQYTTHTLPHPSIIHPHTVVCTIDHKPIQTIQASTRIHRYYLQVNHRRCRR